jgi:lipoprotein-anchoring transpeptidase ErfK/SrfK
VDSEPERVEHEHMTTDQKQRLRDREARLRRESARLRSQRATLVVVLAAFIILGIGYALRPAPAAPSTTSTPQTSSSTASAEASGAPVSAIEATGDASPEASVPATPNAGDPKPTTLRPLSPAPGVKTILVDKSEQTVTLYRADGKPVDRFQCASGEVYPRVGTYRVWGHAKQSWSLTDDTTFFYFTKFATSDKGNSIGFHSIPEEPDGTLVSGLGKPVSAGCVRLAKQKARFVYTWAATGTRVVVKR